MILVADIGGTNARFAIAEREEDAFRVHDPQSFRAEDFESVRDAADAYLESVGLRPKTACFAVAAPTKSDDIAFTNSPWSFNRRAIKRDLSLTAFEVANDFEALAAGIALLPEDFFESVRDGEVDAQAPKLVIGPGTGLGQALLVPCGDGDKVVPTEGGHVSFAPRSDIEFEVLQFIAREHPRVSVERLLSGRGLVNIHRALCHIAGTPRVSLQANEITDAARTGDYPIAKEAVGFFCNLLGAVVGDAVLCCGARGGVFLAGGILPKIKDIFLASEFEAHYLNKGRFKSYVEPVPMTMVVKDGAALYGAASLVS